MKYRHCFGSVMPSLLAGFACVAVLLVGGCGGSAPDVTPRQGAAPGQETATEETATEEEATTETDAKSVAAGESPAASESGGKPLPPLPDASDQVSTEPGWTPEKPTAEEIAREFFLDPPGAAPLTKDGRLWIDVKQRRVIIDGYVALTHGPLEMFACPAGSKEHESIVAVLARSREVHAALLAIDATPGTPVRFRPEFVPPTGQVIRVYVSWYDPEGKFHAVDARQWIQDLETEQSMTAEWVFAGSSFWQDEESKQEFYSADSGDMICVSNFSSAMLDVAIPSSAESDSLRFVPFESEIPSRETPVRLFLVPVPNPTDASDAQEVKDELPVPSAEDVPKSK